jgi:hypothetical protein
MSRPVLDGARLVSIKRGWGYVLNSSVLFAIAQQGGIAGSVLAELGVTEDSLLQTSPGAGDVPGPPADDVFRASEPPNAPEVDELRRRADGFALGLGITDEAAALLLGLAYDRYGTHVPVLRRLGIERDTIVATLTAHGIAVPATPPPPDLPELSDRVVLTRKQAEIVIGKLVQLASSDPGRVLDRTGAGRWAYGAVDGQPGMSQILATDDLDLPAIVDQALRSAGTTTQPKRAEN